MSTQEIQEKEILKEYYSFLYDLASKKNYLHASQLTDEEQQYCDKLLSKCKTKLQLNELYMPLMKNILRRHYSSTSG
jgi:5-bromo-4-chloroindolyl phosphate hydrolysis protein